MGIITNATQTMLDDARIAYHALITGTAPRVVVDVDGTRIEYTSANAARLAAYIQQLEVTLGVAAPTAPRGPMGFYF